MLVARMFYSLTNKYQVFLGKEQRTFETMIVMTNLPGDMHQRTSSALRVVNSSLADQQAKASISYLSRKRSRGQDMMMLR